MKKASRTATPYATLIEYMLIAFSNNLMRLPITHMSISVAG
jgi:hypothetical protein